MPSVGVGTMLFGTIKAPGWGAEELGLCDCEKRKVLPGDKPSDANGVTPKKESPMRKGPCLSCSLPEYISVTSFLKHRFQNIKLLFLTSPYTATTVHDPNGLLPPQPLFGPGCFREALPGREEHARMLIYHH